jgi:hypothetical protein
LARDLHPDRVPGAEEATADERKFTEYLLNNEHPIGRGKAKFFREIGYDSSNWEDLRCTFLTQLPQVEGRHRRTNPNGGSNYEAVLRVQTREGRTTYVRTFWESHPATGTRFLTAYPLASSEETERP